MLNKIKVILSIFLLMNIFAMSSFAQDKTPVLHAMVLVPQGFDDIEFSTVLDMFKRARIHFTTVGIETLKPESISGFPIVADRMTDKVNSRDFDLLILLGAPYATYYNRFPNVESLLHDFNADDKLIGAISLAPLTLDRAGLLKRRSVTIDPAVSGQLSKDVIYIANQAVVDGNIVTGYGPGNAAEFALLIIKTLQGYQVADRVRAELYF